jgi:hypothetical protein
VKPDAIPAAVERIARRTPVTSGLSAKQWQDVPLALRDRATFSAKVESSRFLQSAQDRLLTSIRDARKAIIRPDGQADTVLMDKGRFISEMRRIALDEGLGPTGPRDMEDIRSSSRLGLIFDMAEKQAYGYAQRKVGLDPDVLDAFPAQRLVRIRQSKAPRDWDARWQEAGDQVGWEGALQTDMVALKTSPIWEALSIFGVPWPPFDYGSGMGLRDARRSEAEALGLLDPGERITGDEAEERFNAELEASVKGWRPDQIATLRGAFGDQVQERGGRLVWQGNLIQDLRKEAIADRGYKANVSLGVASPRAINMAAKHDIDLSGTEVRLHADTIRRAWNKHGIGSGDRNPIDETDVEMLPHVWRDPDEVTRGSDGALIFKKNLSGRLVMVEAETSEKNNLAKVKTMYRAS